MAILGANPLINAASNIKLVAIGLTGQDSLVKIDGAFGIPFNNAAAQLVGTTVAGGVTPLSNIAILGTNSFTGTQVVTISGGLSPAFVAFSSNAASRSWYAVGRTSQEGLFGVSSSSDQVVLGDIAGDVTIGAVSPTAALHLFSGIGSVAAIKITGTSATLNGSPLCTGDFKLTVAGKGYYLKEGTNCSMGVVTLNGSSGVTVSTNKVTANSRIFLTIQSPGGTVGSPYINARVPGGNFTIKSVAGDTSLCAWEIREPS